MLSSTPCSQPRALILRSKSISRGHQVPGEKGRHPSMRVRFVDVTGVSIRFCLAHFELRPAPDQAEFERPEYYGNGIATESHVDLLTSAIDLPGSPPLRSKVRRPTSGQEGRRLARERLARATWMSDCSG